MIHFRANKKFDPFVQTDSVIIDSRKRQSEVGGTVTVPWTQNQVIITGLQSGAEYDVTVRTSTTAGMSVMHLSMSCPTYPSAGKGSGFVRV